ncbi:MAG: right-handed parallel beta-helix repeat-containing protein [Candidatus Bathyarchaeota archaeon]|nr:right-handed parallel beta-helix repeat-containing protein [Candidatus Bathyarchaeota archaeon]MDH5595180.1 right-handed parallel beta-helix repeat-containing protein [Candidatus Bathyarchaeota archaeon]
MKLKSVAILFALFLLFFINLRSEASPGNLPVHNMTTALNYATIQEALDAQETLDGHVILVEGGVYYEHVVVRKAVRLWAATHNAIVDGQGAEEVISLKRSGAEIVGFTVKNGSRGIVLRNLQNTSATDNEVFDCSYAGIFLFNCSRCNITDNTVSSNDMAGVYLWESMRNLIANNRVADASHGIYLLVHSTYNLISDNTVVDSPQGIALSYNCDHNTVKGNTVFSSSVGGIVMGGAQNNTIFHNNLLSARAAWSYGDASNFWDSGREGNFWSDYPGSDQNRDGIGDTPYVIDERNRDQHPLMGAFNSFNVRWQEKTDRVTVISNSTISDFNFKTIDALEVMESIEFNVSGGDTYGFCRVMIPISLLNYSYTRVNGEDVNTTILDASNSTHTYLYFTYSITNAKHVTLIPEFPSPYVWSLPIISATLAILFLKRIARRSRNLYMPKSSCKSQRLERRVLGERNL